MTRKPTTTEAKVAQYETLAPLVAAVFHEIQDLSKKRPDEKLGPSKAKLVNRLLADSKSLLADEDNVGYLDLLDDEGNQSNSDAVVIVSLFSAAIRVFHTRYHDWDEKKHNRIWHTE